MTTSTTLEVMHDQVRAIYRAAVGADLPMTEGKPDQAADPEEVARRFTELELIARSIPAVGVRVPPFSFAPLVDVIDEDSEILIEAAVPGVDRADVDVRREGETLVVSGVRRGERVADGRVFLHAEIPCGPFERRIPLPTSIADAEPRVEVQHGMVVIHIPKRPSAAAKGAKNAEKEPKSTAGGKEQRHGHDK